MKKKSGKYVIVRCSAAGVHAGELVEHKGNQVVLANARRLWRWFSSLSLSDLAMEGPRKDKIEENIYSMPVDKITVMDACEVIECSAEGEKGIKEVPNGNR